jgi:type II secretion system-associated lipoprotein
MHFPNTLIIHKTKTAAFILVISSIILSLTSCSSYITKEEKLSLKNYEGQYILLQDAVRNDIKIPKGEQVRLKITATDDYIKVYAMPAKLDIVKGEWILILYLFPDDFEKEKFNRRVFEDRLYQVAKPVK